LKDKSLRTVPGAQLLWIPPHTDEETEPWHAARMITAELGSQRRNLLSLRQTPKI
jgi:hypothetical protein